LHAGAFHTDRDRVVFPIKLGVGVIAEQIVRAEIGDDTLHAGGEVVAVDDCQAVGVFGERTQRVEPGAQPRGVDRQGCHRLEPSRAGLRDRLVEYHQSSGIDRIERRVRPIRLLKEVAKILFVFEHRQRHPITFADLRIGVGIGDAPARRVRRRLARGAARARVDGHLRT
jgi:hypothetical protein